MILKNLDSVYPSLYDLFNQNFTHIDNKNYARIALGSSNTIPYEVNENFKSIILVDETDIDNQDPPFLNRFEKYLVSFDTLLTKDLRNISITIEKIINDLVCLSKNNKKTAINLKNQLINCDLEEIQGIVYKLSKDNNDEVKQINYYEEEVLKILACNFTQDIIAYSDKNGFKEKYPYISEKIKEFYQLTEHNNLKNLLSKLDENINKYIVYTFSGILEQIFDKKDSKILNQTYGEFNREKTFIQFVEKINNEIEIDGILEDFYNEKKNYNLLVFKFDVEDCEHLNHIKYLIENYQRDNIENINKKVILFTIHINRISDVVLNNQHLVSHISNFGQTFIDNLSGKNVSILDYINKSNNDLLSDHNLFNINEEYQKNIYLALTSIRYNYKFDKEENNDNIYGNYINYITENILRSNELSQILIDTNKKMFNNNENLFYSIFYDNKIFEPTDVELVSVISKYLSYLFLLNLKKVIIKSERDGVISSFINSMKLNKIFAQQILEYYFKNTDFNFNINDGIRANQVDLYYGLMIPSTKYCFSSIRENIEKIKEKYLKNEDQIRNCSENHCDYIDNYLQEKSNLEQNVKNILLEQNIFKYINEEMNDEIYNYIFEDFMTIIISLKFPEEKKDNLKYMKQILKEICKIYLSNEIINYDFDVISKFLLWIECYELTIFEIIKYYSIFQNIIPQNLNLLDKIITSINNNSVKFTIDRRNPEYKRYINEKLTLIIESLTYSIFSDLSFIQNQNFDEEKLHDLVKKLKEFTQIIIQAKTNLYLYLKEIYTLNIFLSIQDALLKNGKFNKENLLTINNFLNDEKRNINENNFDNAINILNKEYNYLNNLLKDSEQFPELIISIFSEKLKQVDNINYRKTIFQIVFKNIKLLKKSKILFIIFFTRFNLIPHIDDEEDNENNINDYDEDNEEFLSFVQEDDEILKLINNQNENRKILDEILFYIFEILINKFFDENNYSIEKSIKGKSFQFLQKSFKFIEENNNSEIKHLGDLYACAYIKCYFYYFVKYVKNSNQEVGNTVEINQFLCQKTIPFRRVIKLYILKLFRILYTKSYQEFKILDWQLYQINWVNEFNFQEEVESNLDYIFLNANKYDDYKKYVTIFESSKDYNFRDNPNVFIDYINNNSNIGFIIIFDICINKFINKLYNINFISDSDSYSNFSNYFIYIFKRLQLPEYITKFTDIFFNKTVFIQKFQPLIINKNLNFEQFEILLYGYKICLISILNLKNQNNKYYNCLISNNAKKTINEFYIPGGEPNPARMIRSFPQIKKFLLSTNDPSQGAYICSCGYWYNIEPCGLPAVEDVCPTCNQKIGGTRHRLVQRPNHFRIYKDQAQRTSVERRSYYGHVDGMLLADFEVKVNQERAKEDIGYVKCDYLFFKDNLKVVRNIDIITYRILNFIFYNAILYDQLLGYLNENDIKAFCVENKTPLDCIFENWNLLKELLNGKGINNIKIYFNYIIPKIQNLLLNLISPITKEQRKEFEEQINNIVKTSFQEYNTFSQTYTKINQEMLRFTPTSIKVLINESDFNELPKKDYPFFNYFVVPSYPTLDFLKNKLEEIPDYFKKYPVISTYINNKEKDDIDNLQYIIDMNPFEDYAIKKYSYTITRDEANNKKIGDELNVIDDDNVKKSYKKFEKAYNSITKLCNKYGCRPIMKEHLINENDCIKYILNDDGELGFGMHLAAIYQNFISWQNSFLNSIIENIKLNGILHYFVDNCSKEILCQNATKNEIVSLDIDSDIYYSFYEIFSYNSNRNHIDDNGNINYMNYRNITFDFDIIENELGKCILSGKKKFKDEQIFVTYRFEGYHGNKSSIIPNFIKKYPQKDLSEDTKNYLDEFKRNNGKEYKNILFNLQIIIFYIVDDSKKHELNKNISEIINELPQYINISNSCRLLFSEHYIPIENLIGIYEFIEHLSYNLIKENVNEIYNKKISEENTQKITKYFTNKNLFITKLKLATAVRKFISRFLSGRRSDEEFKATESILMYLQNKEEIWEKSMFYNEKFDQDMEKLFEEFSDIKLENSLTFYDVLGQDLELLGERKPLNNNFDERRPDKKDKNKKTRQRQKF